MTLDKEEVLMNFFLNKKKFFILLAKEQHKVIYFVQSVYHTVNHSPTKWWMRWTILAILVKPGMQIVT